LKPPENPSLTVPKAPVSENRKNKKETVSYKHLPYNNSFFLLCVGLLLGKLLPKPEPNVGCWGTAEGKTKPPAEALPILFVLPTLLKEVVEAVLFNRRLGTAILRSGWGLFGRLLLKKK
jgi:hypothetical protein